MKIAITGHRPNKLGNDYDLTSDLILSIRNEILGIITKANFEDGVPTLITGMALGIDTLFAKIAIEFDIPFIAALPFQNQEKLWPEKSQSRYREIINHPLCTKRIISSGTYTPNKMQIRNMWMVDNCDLLIAVWDGSTGGTANCVKYAQSVNKEIIIINPIKYA